MKRKLCKILLWTLVSMFCSTGLIIQIKYVSDRYMAYMTRTVVDMIIPTNLPIFPSVSVCLYTLAVFNENSVGMKYNISGHKLRDEFRKKIGNLSIHQLFEYTPREDEIIKYYNPACLIRYATDFSLTAANTSGCYERYNITKYFERGYVCYEFKLKSSNETLDMVSYTLAPAYSGEMYRIWLNNSLFKVPEPVSISVHTNESSVLFDSVFSSNHYHRNVSKPGFKIFYREVQRKQKEYPYDTGCINIPKKFSTGIEESLFKSNQDYTNLYNYSLPFLRIYNRSSPYMLLQEIDMRNKDQKEKLRSVLMKYPAMKECVTKFVDTTADMIDENYSYIALSWPQNEKLSIENKPDQELIDYIVYIGSCIGIWFGLSAYSFYDGINFITDMVFKPVQIEDSQIFSIQSVADRQRDRMNNLHMAQIFRILSQQNMKSDDAINKQIVFQNTVNERFDMIENKLKNLIDSIRNDQEA